MDYEKAQGPCGPAEVGELSSALSDTHPRYLEAALREWESEEAFGVVWGAEYRNRVKEGDGRIGVRIKMDTAQNQARERRPPGQAPHSFIKHLLKTV